MNKVTPLLEMHITCDDKGEIFETVRFGTDTLKMIDYLESGGLKVLKLRVNLARVAA